MTYILTCHLDFAGHSFEIHTSAVIQGLCVLQCFIVVIFSYFIVVIAVKGLLKRV